MKPKFNMLHSSSVQSSRRLATALIWGLCLCGLAVTALLALPSSVVKADGPHQGQVVVVFPGEKSTVRPISYTAGISRVAALKLSGWDVEASGDAVCSIDGVGCPATDCFCADNWWSSAEWSPTENNWDTSFPPTDVDEGDIIGFRWSNTAWGPPSLPGSVYTSALKTLDYVRAQQNSDGGYGNPSTAGATVEAHLTIGANGLAATEWTKDGQSLLDFWNVSNSPNKAAVFANSNAGRAGKLAVAVAGAQGDPQNFTSQNLNLGITLTTYYSPTTGAFDASNTLNHMWAMLGWQATYTDSKPVPYTATKFLLSRGNGNGTWSWAPGQLPDSNVTALAVQALIAGGECITSAHVSKSINYFQSIQNDDGGFPNDAGQQSDTNSTAWVIQALMAVGENPASDTWTVNGNTPFDFLLSMRLPDGALAWQSPSAGTNLLATQQAVLGLLGRPLPLNTMRPKQCSAPLLVYLPMVLK
jgi:hypothetical protein